MNQLQNTLQALQISPHRTLDVVLVPPVAAVDALAGAHDVAGVAPEPARAHRPVYPVVLAPGPGTG